MKLIMGLGNVGEKYRNTRHNVGFVVADRLAKICQANWVERKKFDSLLCQVEMSGQPVIIGKPTKFMNMSGIAAKKIAQYFNIEPVDVMVIHDDLDLPTGTVRLKLAGGTGGHHGLDSIHQNLGTDGYARCRIGIGKQGKEVLTSEQGAVHVLGRPNRADSKLLAEAFDRAEQAILCWIERGMDECMNEFN